MPITLTLTKDVLSSGQETLAISKITESFLKHHGLSGNTVMTPNVTAHIVIVEKGCSFAGGKPVEGAWIETKTPSFALADHAVQSAFFGEATQILHDLSGGTLSKDRIWSNGVHAVDGTWNISGKALKNAEIGEAISAG
ncbi:4-oxalocrotonate tautomerase [Kiloniella sp. EL199]|uniref:4-oxalocrotonate tautomerase n=1 Tax=Kiloniella sp. EL199 TaxID=2107581 RepID=UPI000EA0AAE6|nr:4-oxalocrotonate tautomerase [Kiloniella sp. EL199]